MHESREGFGGRKDIHTLHTNTNGKKESRRLGRFVEQNKEEADGAICACHAEGRTLS